MLNGENNNPEENNNNLPENLDSLSDEEIMNLDFADLPELEEVDANSDNTDEVELEDTSEEDVDNDEELEDTSAEEQEEVSENDEEVSDTDEKAGEESDDEGDEDNVKETDDSDDESNDEEDESNRYKSFYDKIMGPHKVQGKDFTPRSEEEVQRLISQGVDYNLKMGAFKPYRRHIRTLEENDLLDDSKLNFLIDVSKGNKEAIRELIKQHKLDLDTLEVDEDSDTAYKPGSYTVDDEQLDLEEGFKNIQHSEFYPKITEVISNEWDDRSRQIIYKHPQIPQTLENHMRTGVYDKVSAEVGRRKMLGELGNYSDLEAYWFVGEQLAQEDKLRAAQEPPKPASPEKRVIKPKARKSAPANSNKRKAAAATGRTKATSKATYDPMLKSDEEFEKEFEQLVLSGKLS